jgi:hypothetical protein
MTNETLTEKITKLKDIGCDPLLLIASSAREGDLGPCGEMHAHRDFDFYIGKHRSVNYFLKLREISGKHYFTSRKLSNSHELPPEGETRSEDDWWDLLERVSYDLIWGQQDTSHKLITKDDFDTALNYLKRSTIYDLQEVADSDEDELRLVRIK